jgi:hypothetical protein
VRLALQTAVVLLAARAYRFVRGLTEGDRATAEQNGRILLDIERLTGLDVELGIQSVVLQSRLLIDLCNRIYVFAYWPTIIVALVALFVLDRSLFRVYRNALFISGAIGLVVFATFPVAPPRMAPGFVDTVHRFTDSTSIARPGDFTNEFAAMPSFHVGWMLLAGLAAMPLVRRWWARALLLVPAGVMTFVVMATANHYLIDAIVGGAVVAAALAVARRIEATAPERRARSLRLATAQCRRTRRPARVTIPRRDRRPVPALLQT